MAQLVAAGCGVDLTTNDGWTALHEAAANGHTVVVQQLLDACSQVILPHGHALRAPCTVCSKAIISKAFPLTEGH